MLKTLDMVVERIIKQGYRSLLGNNDCVYTSYINGKKCHCAVGLLLKPEYKKVSWDENKSSYCNRVRAGLQDRYKDLPYRFLYDLQSDIHDSECSWTYTDKNNTKIKGLSKIGRIRLNKIESYIKKGTYNLID